MSVRREVLRERRQQVRLNGRRLTHPAWGQLGLRFLFGAAIAIAAGLAGLRWGHRVGGVFLAFPAILPAALTLLERADGTAETDVDAAGACLGAVAMLLFAITLAALAPRLGLVAVLLAAIVWALAALGLFAVARPLGVRLVKRS